MATTSLLSLLMGDASIGSPDHSSDDPVGDKRSLRGNVPGSLAPVTVDGNERYNYTNCRFPILVDRKQTTARSQEPHEEPPPYSYSPDAYDTENSAGCCATRIEMDEPPLDAYPSTDRYHDYSPMATPTIRNTRRRASQPWSQHQRTTGVISPINNDLWAGSPLTSSSISALEREYDRDTWRLFHRIQHARSLQQQQQPQTSKQQELVATTRLQPNQRRVSSEGLLAGEELEDDGHVLMTTDDDEDEEIMFAMDY